MLNWKAAEADFQYWATVARWSLDETIALLLGKSPNEVTWKSVHAFVSVSDFAKEYERLRSLALKSDAMERGQRPVPPSVVLAWAAESAIAVPPSLAAAIEARQAKKLAIAAKRVKEPHPSHALRGTVPALAHAIPVLQAVVAETPQQRRTRLGKRREELKVQGVRDFGKRLASEEGISTERLRAILKKPKPQARKN